MTVRIANELGALSAPNIRVATRVGFFATVAMIVATIAVLLAGYKGIPHILISDDEVRAASARAMFIVAAMMPGMCLGMAFIGAVLGRAHGVIGAAMTVVAFVVGIPVGAGIGIGAKMGANGLLIGLLVAYTAQPVLLGAALLRRSVDADVDRKRKAQPALVTRSTITTAASMALSKEPTLAAVTSIAAATAMVADWQRRVVQSSSLQTALSMASGGGGMGMPVLAPAYSSAGIDNADAVSTSLDQQRSIALDRLQTQHTAALLRAQNTLAGAQTLQGVMEGFSEGEDEGDVENNGGGVREAAVGGAVSAASPTAARKGGFGPGAPASIPKRDQDDE